MSQLWIVVGDKTTHGGVVVTGSPFTDIDGKPVARVGDKVACPKCGPTSIVTGDPTIEIDGAIVARHNDATACGSTLIAASQFRVFITAGGGAQGGASASTATGAGSRHGSKHERRSASSAVAVARKPFDEQFRAVDSNGQPVPGLPYRIELADGTAIRGLTDGEGKTLRVATESPEELKLSWEAADPDEEHEDGECDLPEEC